MAIAREHVCIDNLPPGLPGHISQDYEGFLRVAELRAFIIASPNRSSPSDRPLTGIITVHPITSIVNNVTNKLHHAQSSYNFANAQVPGPRLI